MKKDEKSENLLTSYSIVERHFYLMVLRCKQCGKGPFEFVSQERNTADNIDIWYVKCKSCHQGQQLLFDRRTLKIDTEQFSENDLPVVNPSDTPSKLIDVGQWLAIFHAILSAAYQHENKKQAQRLGYEATLALEEAIKFYQLDNDLPPASAFWSDSSIKQFKEHPELFDKHRLLQMREKLPALKVMQASIIEAEKKQRKKAEKKEKVSWWRRWFRRQK